MKKRPLLTLLAMLASSYLVADGTTIVDTAFVQQDAVNSSAKSSHICDPFGVEVKGVWIGNSKFNHDKHQHLKYSEAEADIYFTQKVTHCEGFSAFLGYDVTTMRWKENPFFDQERFRSYDIGLLGYTNRFKDWLWQLGVSTQTTSGNGSWGKNTLYTGMLWGRYTYCSTVGLHLGFIGFAGLRKEEVYPIIGFDYSPSKQWQFNAVFPVNMTAVCNLSTSWSLSLELRPFRSRHRAGANQVLPQAIFEYHDFGADLALVYHAHGLFASLFAGGAFGGTLRVKNHLGNTIFTEKFGGAPYVGLAAYYKF